MTDSTRSTEPRGAEPDTDRAEDREWIFVPASVAASYWTWVILSRTAA
jgi:hypothetical protein